MIGIPFLLLFFWWSWKITCHGPSEPDTALKTSWQPREDVPEIAISRSSASVIPLSGRKSSVDPIRAGRRS